MPELFGADCYSPREIAERVENVGVTKAHLPLLPLAALGVLAGGFIGLGAILFTVVQSDSHLSFALQRVLGGVGFSLGLILVVLAGAELFTGNNLLVMAWVSKRISTSHLCRNLLIVYVANLVGAVGLAVLVALSGHAKLGNGAIERTAILLAATKTAMPFAEAFAKGILCNLLVCLAVWIAMAGRNVTDKVVAILFPITAFVAAGFEHSIANMYFIPLGIFLNQASASPTVSGAESLNVAGFLHNLIPVTLGNLLGGAGLVGLVFWVIYRRENSAGPSGVPEEKK